MEVKKQYEAALQKLFPGVLIDNDIDGCLLIRTDNWMIDSSELDALKGLDLNICQIMIDGGGICLTIDRKSSKKVFIRQSCFL